MAQDLRGSFERYIDDFLEQSKTKIQEAVAIVQKETWDDFIHIVEERIKEMFNDVIQEFYNDYSPETYDRNESLYDLLQTDTTDSSLMVWFDPSKMTPFRSGYDGEDGLYDQVFRHGWHGGAASGEGHPSPGTPYWRTPVPYYNRWGREAAIASVSPLDNMMQRVRDYEERGIRNDFIQTWSLHAKDITIK